MWLYFENNQFKSLFSVITSTIVISQASYSSGTSMWDFECCMQICELLRDKLNMLTHLLEDKYI